MIVDKYPPAIAAASEEVKQEYNELRQKANERVSTLNQKIRELLDEVDEMKQDLAYKDKKLTEQARKDEFRKKVLAIPTRKFSAYDKVATLATAYDLDGKKVEPDGLKKVWAPILEEKSGISDDVIARTHNKLVACGGVDKRTTQDKEGKRHTSLNFTPEFLADPEGVISGLPDNGIGGTRIKKVRCPDCGGVHPLVKRTTFTCTGCGTVIRKLTKDHIIEQTEDDPIEDHLPEYPDPDEPIPVEPMEPEEMAAIIAAMEEEEKEKVTRQALPPLPRISRNRKRKELLSS